MEQLDLILEQEDAIVIDQCLESFLENTGASIVMVLGRDGNLIARHGEYDEADVDSLCALSAGAFASSESLASMAGETLFNSIAHHGKVCNLYITVAGESNLLLVVYNKQSSSALVRMQAKVTAEAIIHILEKAYAREKSLRRNSSRNSVR